MLSTPQVLLPISPTSPPRPYVEEPNPWLYKRSQISQKITGYLPKDDGAKAAFKDADIIVIPAGIPRKQNAPMKL